MKRLLLTLEFWLIVAVSVAGLPWDWSGLPDKGELNITAPSSALV